ncbi:MAG: hypothetical protein AAF598_20305, partial [Bacteroidota bacterium]
NKKCDNCRHPKEKVDAAKSLNLALESVLQMNEKYRVKTMIDFLGGMLLVMRYQTLDSISSKILVKERKKTATTGTQSYVPPYYKIISERILKIMVYSR